MNWLVYIVECSDSSLYTGITNDIARRYRQHGEHRGAKYFRGRQPVRLVYIEHGHDRSSAARREIGIKKLSRNEKLQLIDSDCNQISSVTIG